MASDLCLLYRTIDLATRHPSSITTAGIAAAAAAVVVVTVIHNGCIMAHDAVTACS